MKINLENQNQLLHHQEKNLKIIDLWMMPILQHQEKDFFQTINQENHTQEEIEFKKKNWISTSPKN